MDTILLFFPCINTFLRFGGLPWFLIGKESACSTGDVEDPLEKEIATYSSIVAWKILWTEEPGGLQSMGLLIVDMTEQLPFHFSLSCIGEGNGNPL